MKSIRVIVAHGGYGCDTGCCGHWVELADREEIGDGFTEGYIGDGFQFTHPPYKADFREWAIAFAQEQVEREYGKDHVADLDWEHSFVMDD